MSKLRITRKGYALGAEIAGVDATRPLDAQTVDEIRKAWLDNTVVYLPGQDLDPGEFRTFCDQFGELDVDNIALLNLVPDMPQVIVRSNQPVTFAGAQIRQSSAADRWHTDFSYRERPSTMTFLLAKDLPDVGGDTQFASLYAAYETLSPAYKALIDPLVTVRDYALGAASYGTMSPDEQARQKQLKPDVAHPLVRTHPETGRKLLYVDAFIRNIEGMTDEESKPILDHLLAHATRYEFTYRHRWSPGDLIAWDNRCAIHFAVQDYDRSQLRRTLRCSLVGPKTGTLYAPAGEAVAAPA